MTFAVALTAAAAFLSAAAIVILAILVAGIRSDDRAKALTRAPRTRTQEITAGCSASASAPRRCRPCGVGSLRIYVMLVTPLSSHMHRIDAINNLHTQLGTLRVNVWVLVYCLDMAFADGTQA
jgi:hypothetical protein